MSSLKKFLQKQGYTATKLKVLKSQHIAVKASLNGIKEWFILDTGASFTCVDGTDAAFFNLDSKYSEHKAAGAGATGMATRIAFSNKLQIGAWENSDQDIMLIDLSHVNQALEEYGAQRIRGILGADVLKSSKCVIDYRKRRVYWRLHR